LIDDSDSWEIAIPCVIATVLLIMRGMIADYVKSLMQRRRIFQLRKAGRRRKQKPG
jgi:hypothetical protein